jgi:hypothetical protein
MFDMSKLHLLLTNNTAGLLAKIDGNIYNVMVSIQKIAQHMYRDFVQSSAHIVMFTQLKRAIKIKSGVGTGMWTGTEADI